MAILVPDDKLDCFVSVEFFSLAQNGQAFDPVAVLPPWIDGSPFQNV